MNRIEPIQCCHESRENIPWLVNDTLSNSAAAKVREHIKDCLVCRADFDLHVEMRAAALGGEVTPMIPMTKAADVISIGGNGYTQRLPNKRSRLIAIAAGIAIIGVAIGMTVSLDRGAEETRPSFETATSTGLPVGIDYVMQLQFETGVSEAERDKIVAQLAGVVQRSVSDRGVYEVHVQLTKPSLKILQEYEERVVALEGVRSAKFTALQLPVR